MLTRSVVQPVTSLVIANPTFGKGEELFPNLLSNGEFDDNIVGWTPYDGNTTATHDAGRLRIANNGAVYSAVSQSIYGLIIGRVYRVTCDVTYGGSGKARSSATVGVASTIAGGFDAASTGTYTYTFTATATTMMINFGNRNDNNAFHFYDNIICRLDS